MLRYRAMVNTVSASGLTARAYFHRYSEDALDLCDCLGSFTSNAKVKLHELCRALGLPGKPDEIDGSKVDEFVRADRIREVSEYCECTPTGIAVNFDPDRAVRYDLEGHALEILRGAVRMGETRVSVGGKRISRVFALDQTR